MKAFRFTSHMRQTLLALPALVALALLSSAPPAFGADTLSSATTYSILTQNNTSADLASTGQSSGAPSENVSKISIASVLPAGTNTHIYAHFLTWFGTAGHQDVGYNSADAVQVQKQVSDMMSRGINGVIVNWQGSTDPTNQAALLITAESDAQAGSFTFSIEDDAHSLAVCAATAGCNLTSKLVDDLTYIQNTYTTAKSYMMFDGRPVIFLYGMEAYNLDWTRIRASLAGNPVLVLRSASGTTSAQVNLSSPVHCVEPSVLAESLPAPRTRSHSTSEAHNA